MNRYSLIGFQFWIRRKLGTKLARDYTSKVNGKKRGIINTMSEYEMRKLLKKTGYKIIKIHRFSLLPGRKSLILLPKKIILPLEKIMSKIPIINLFGKDQIYVCKKIVK